MPYDPFGEAEPIAAVFTGKTHSKEFWSEVSESNTPAVEVYSLYEENGQGYWLYGERAVGQPRWREGFFVSVPRSERSWFLESYHEKDREPDPTWKVGYVLQGVDATSAIGRRNLAFVGLLVFWIVVFVLEEGRFQRRRKKRPTPSG
ncbi:MAG: hypothetical protein CSA24_01335 [Deltaproteobacteria bacterium]|nr:MAG: hypothetical protein CSA24_01335 [Deltaproteobacteria bacterium]